MRKILQKGFMMSFLSWISETQQKDLAEGFHDEALFQCLVEGINAVADVPLEGSEEDVEANNNEDIADPLVGEGEEKEQEPVEQRRNTWSPDQIAMKELRERKIPFTIRRYLPD
ncbi:hypothetical protein Sjap_006249 [Stephania japonica]|uniref:Uncharacterized protein n=1 Tax=Stephania japonica TaxID=461633 RepID=A0AAP0K5N8_9MAGN